MLAKGLCAQSFAFRTRRLPQRCSLAVSAAGASTMGEQTVRALWEPAGKPTCDVVFFHGLQLGSYEHAWQHTWKNKEGVLWPEEWLGKQDFPTARILSICYDSQAIRGGKTMEQIANTLVQEVCVQAKVGQDCPVVLVGHSLGGLVLKKLAMKAYKEAGLEGSALSSYCKAFCSNLAGTFFFATPHGGAALGSLANRIFGAVGQAGPVLDYLEMFSSQGAELNRDFMLAFPTLCFMALVETRRYRPGWLFPGVQVVPEGSAMQGMHNYIEVNEDHISICKPSSTGASTYRYFRQYLQDALKRFQEHKVVLEVARQQLLTTSTLAQLELTREEMRFNARFTDQVEPSMSWFRDQKVRLEPQLGDRWAEGLYAPNLSKEDLATTEKHRQVTRNFWSDVQIMCRDGLFDDSFFSGKWARRARDYRLLLEPVEIANYYRRGLQNDTGHYIDSITMELTDDNNRRPGRFILLQKQEQRVYGGANAAYITRSSLGLARMLKEKVGSRTWQEYMQQQNGEEPLAEELV